MQSVVLCSLCTLSTTYLERVQCILHENTQLQYIALSMQILANNAIMDFSV